MKEFIKTDKAPSAIGAYSQAVKVRDTVYLSGQIALDAHSMTLVDGGFESQLNQCFKNLKEVCMASGGDLDNIVKLNIYLTDMNDFPAVNEVMSTFFSEPYPARAAIGVAALPKNALVEMDGVMSLEA